MRRDYQYVLAIYQWDTGNSHDYPFILKSILSKNLFYPKASFSILSAISSCLADIQKATDPAKS